MSQPKQDVCFFSATGVFAQGMLKAVDMFLQPQDICMLSGPSGSGKSQFLKALADLIKHQGEVCLEEQMLDKVCPETWRSQVMYFAAETAWWQDTVIAHFDQGLETDCLKGVGLGKDVLESNPDSLSSGEKQRLALLRGLQYQPKILLLDEITANLDPKSEQLVETLVKEYVDQHQAAAIWISHDPNQSQRMATKKLVFEAKNTEEVER